MALGVTAMYAASLSFRFVGSSSLVRIVAWSHCIRCSSSQESWARRDFSVSPRPVKFWWSLTFTCRGLPLSPMYGRPHSQGILNTQLFDFCISIWDLVLVRRDLIVLLDSYIWNHSGTCLFLSCLVLVDFVVVGPSLLLSCINVQLG